MAQPNVVLIICDQMRGDCIGADGHPVAQTPNIDYLASIGTRFPCAYSAVPSCLPARATLWSGQNQWHTGVLGMGRGQGHVPNDFQHTLAGELSRAGYRTHLVGKSHFHPIRTSMGFQSQELDESGRTMVMGFLDEYRTWFKEHAPVGVTPDDHGVFWNSWHARPWHTHEHLHPTAWTMTRAIEFLEKRDPEVPFFLNISVARPHSPYVPPKTFWDMYIDEDLPEPYVGEWSAMHDDPNTARDPNAWRGKMAPKQVHRARAGYLGEISFIDTQVGRLLNHLYRFDRQALNNTWFIFTADHGDMQGDHHLWRKTYAYEGSTRIPFIVVPPKSAGLNPRPHAEEVVELRDIMPTVLEATGGTIPETVDGESLVSVIQTPQKQWRPYIHGEHCTCYSTEQEMHFVTDGKRKYVWLPRLDKEQFFDLVQDPGECVDLSETPDRQEELETWRNHLIRELKARDCGWVDNDRPACPSDAPLVSPYKTVRWNGTSP